MTSLNLGILAHVDAGKTSLTERLLDAAAVIDEIGSVDRGSTQTDSLALERARGITITAAVVSFDLGHLTVNLLDTPGHPDFIAEWNGCSTSWTAPCSWCPRSRACRRRPGSCCGPCAGSGSRR